MKDPVKCVTEELRADMERLGNVRSESLGSSAQLEIMTRVFLQHEARRVEAKLGPRHPRTARLRARLESGAAIARALEVERQVYRIKVPDVTGEAALVHGRTVDDQGRGIAGLLVCLLDATGTPLGEVPDATTDDSGYFAHPLDPELLGRLLETQEDGIFLGTFTPRGQPVHRSRKPLALDQGARLFSEIKLDRRIVAEKNQSEWTEEEETEPSVSVPDLIGLSEDEATAALKRLRLELGRRRTKYAPDSAGKILEQDPSGETEVPVGTAVNVVIGVAEREDDVEVPRVTGIKLNSARRKLSRYNVELGNVEYRPSDTAGVVLEQDPGEGERVQPGTPVNLVVGAEET